MNSKEKSFNLPKIPFKSSKSLIFLSYEKQRTFVCVTASVHREGNERSLRRKRRLVVYINANSLPQVDAEGGCC